MSRAYRLVLAAVIAAMGATIRPSSARAQGAAPPPAPAMASGKVDQYLLTPEGVLDGLLLQNNTIVRFAPVMRNEIFQSVRPGDSVVVTGIPEAFGQIRAQKIEDKTTLSTISEIPSGPPSTPGDRQVMTVSGTVRVVTRGQRGEVTGAVLNNGAVVHVTPEAAAYFANLFRPEQPLAANGWGTINTYGKSVEASSLGPSIDKLTPLPPPPGGPRP